MRNLFTTKKSREKSLEYVRQLGKGEDVEVRDTKDGIEALAVTPLLEAISAPVEKAAKLFGVRLVRARLCLEFEDD